MPKRGAKRTASWKKCGRATTWLYVELGIETILIVFNV
jgi:hypothetical protein